MAGPAVGRIRRELDALNAQRDAASGVRWSPVEGDLRHLRGVLEGPKGTPYEGGTFEVDIEITPQYPFEPPKMRFITAVWHPNVSSQTGAICLDILKDQWSPALSIKTALVSLQALLSAPEPDDPQDAQVAAQYKRDRRSWEETARLWTQSYAGASSERTLATSESRSEAAGRASVVDMSASTSSRPADETPYVSALATITAMGFDRTAAVRALSWANGDVEQAVQKLLGDGGELGNHA